MGVEKVKSIFLVLIDLLIILPAAPSSISFLIPAISTMGDDYGDHSTCYFHPKEVVVGICALCLKERLLFLASKQAHRRPHLLPLITKNSKRAILKRMISRRPTFALPKVFALGSFMHLLHESSHHPQDEASVASLDDEDYISIKFGEDGKGTWNSKKSIEPLSSTAVSNAGGVEEASKQYSVVARWRKRIGRLLHVGLWKRSNKASACHVVTVDKGF
ncbi:hypothetical protein Cni_G27578 [Canna indica]|uniref:Uncharacterized protein n=1 Tax=Canna indica TaxID=4628 RepID=A0AAQ3QRI9_9LILI|nr:hypothetical protein Cni_G27578 [Canna indica]